MWEISENLHRNNLDRMQRALHEAEWVRLAEEEALVGQVDPLKGPGKGRHSEGGIRKAARDLPIKGDTEESRRARLRRDLKIAAAGMFVGWECSELSNERGCGLPIFKLGQLDPVSEPGT